MLTVPCIPAASRAEPGVLAARHERGAALLAVSDISHRSCSHIERPSAAGMGHPTPVLPVPGLISSRSRRRRRGRAPRPGAARSCRAARMVVTVPRVHAAPERCGFRSGSAADGHGIPASFSARVIRATLCPASRCANIHRNTCAVSGSGSSRCARLPQAACALFGCGPASASRYPYGGRPPS